MIPEDSILLNVKQILGISDNDTSFDQEIIMHINSVFLVLNQLGVGPKEGYSISGYSDEWSDYIGSNANLNGVKTYMGLKVRMIFDPPTSGSIAEAFKSLISELEWRLNLEVDK